jgi:antirestriction protein ArdC
MSYVKEKLNGIVRSFVEKLEAGTPPWVKPYAIAGGGNNLPANRRTFKPYRGINIMMLWMAGSAHGFSSRYWLTFKQAHSMGGRVKKGEKGTPIMFWTEYDKSKVKDTVEDEYDPNADKAWVLRFYTVFNLDQIDGISDPDAISDLSLIEDNRLRENPRVMEFVGKTGAVVKGGNTPCYIPSADRIEMPPIKSFINTEGYHASLLHELSHWSGHSDRLNRLAIDTKFGDTAYAFEELIAEMGSAFLCSYLGVPLENAQHPEYLAYWAKVISDKPSILWKAATKSQALHDYLMAITGETIESEEPSWEEVGAA